MCTCRKLYNVAYITVAWVLLVEWSDVPLHLAMCYCRDSCMLWCITVGLDVLLFNSLRTVYNSTEEQCIIIVWTFLQLEMHIHVYVVYSSLRYTDLTVLPWPCSSAKTPLHDMSNHPPTHYIQLSPYSFFVNGQLSTYLISFFKCDYWDLSQADIKPSTTSRWTSIFFLYNNNF